MKGCDELKIEKNTEYSTGMLQKFKKRYSTGGFHSKVAKQEQFWSAAPSVTDAEDGCFLHFQLRCLVYLNGTG